MKFLTYFPASMITLFLLQSTGFAANVKIEMKGQEAKQIYNALTGSKIQNDAGAGHLYRLGQSIQCQYVDVDMNDAKGNPVPQNDPLRYRCHIQFNANGLASSY